MEESPPATPPEVSTLTELVDMVMLYPLTFTTTPGSLVFRCGYSHCDMEIGRYPRGTTIRMDSISQKIVRHQYVCLNMIRKVT